SRTQRCCALRSGAPRSSATRRAGTASRRACARHSSMRSSRPDMTDARPFTLLIAALGGGGGGVLNDWVVECALSQGLPVQATSVPGVAQRTGSTSYYIEMMRTPAPDGAQPVFALNPMPGGVDVVLASELAEAGRMI